MISVIIVNWNVRTDLERCIRSLPQQVLGDNIEVIVVDNGSWDGSLAMLEEQFPNVNVIANEWNVGFAAASNQGLRAASGDILVLLNPDTMMCDGALSHLAARFDADPSVGVVTPQLLNEDGTVQSSRRRFPTRGTALIESTPLQQFMPRHRLLRRYYISDMPDDVAQEIDWAVGACLAVKRKALEDAGYLDESFLMYSEEMDWCLRIKQQGWKVIYEPAARVVHFGGKSADQNVLSRHLLFQASKVQFYQKHFGPAFGSLLRLYLLACYVCQGASELAKYVVGHKRDLRRQRLDMYRRILCSGLRAALPQQASFGGTAHLRVLMISAEYPPKRGGVGDYTRCLVSTLADQGAEVRVLTSPAPRNGPETAEDPGFAVDRRASAWNWSCWNAAKSVIRAFKPDIVHIQYQTGAYAMHPAMNMLPLLIGRLDNAPKSVVTFHDLLLPYLFPKAGRARALANTAIFRGADHLIVTNEEDLASLPAESLHKSSLVPIGSNISVSPPDGFDRGDWRARLGIADYDLVVAHFGFLTESKGIGDLVEAIGILTRKQPELHTKLLIIGAGSGDSDVTHENYEEVVKKSIERLRLTDRIIWTGFATGEQVSAHLLSSDLAVLPYHDGASMRRGTLLAALAHGLPVITTQPVRPLTGRWLADGVNILLVPARSPEQLAAAISRLATDRNQRELLRNGAKDLASRVGWGHIGSEHLRLYERLVGQRVQRVH